MDDLRASLGAFDPDAPLPAAPEPWAYLPTPAFRDGPPWAMAEMIAVEPALAARIADRVEADGSAAALAAAIAETARRGEPVIITGCGTSEHAAMAMVEVLRDAWGAAGLPGPGPVAAQAFELSLDPPGSGLVVGVSHEGGTAATIAALHAALSAGARTALVTASAGSPAAAAADVVVATVEMDGSWCHTVGYVSPIVVATVVARHLGGAAAPADAGGSAASRLRSGIEAAHAVGADGDRPDETIATTVAGAARLLVLGSGVDRVTARELVLKVEEASWLPAAARDLETFLHGHLPSTGPDTSLVLVLVGRRGAAARAARARQALTAAIEVGMRPAAIVGAGADAAIPAGLTPGGRIVVPEAPAGADRGPDAADALLGAAGPLQLVTLAIAAARGTNPDPIRRDDPRYLRAAELADDPSL